MNPLPETYHDQTKRPFLAMLAIIPLLVVYEGNALLNPADWARCGLERWFFSWFDAMGLAPLLVLSLGSIAVVLVWHRRRGDGWTARPTYVAGMFVESLMLGAMLYCATRAVLEASFMPSPAPLSVSATSQAYGTMLWIARALPHFGTSVFEEILFRLLLFSVCLGFIRLFIRREIALVLLASCITGVLFSGMHYSMWNPAGAPFEWTGFLCRSVLGMSFSCMFFYRGLGIAVGSHAVYNVLTVSF